MIKGWWLSWGGGFSLKVCDLIVYNELEFQPEALNKYQYMSQSLEAYDFFFFLLNFSNTNKQFIIFNSCLRYLSVLLSYNKNLTAVNFLFSGTTINFNKGGISVGKISSKWTRCPQILGNGVSLCFFAKEAYWCMLGH